MTEQITTLVTVIGFFALWIGTWLVLALPLLKKFQWRPFRATAPEQKLILLMPLYLLAPGVIWGANQLLDQHWQTQGVSLGLTSLRPFVIGWGVAITGLGLLLWFKKSVGLITFGATSSPDESAAPLGPKLLAILGLLVLGIWIGGIEELVFRGWLQTQLTSAFAPWLAATLGSLVFASAHLVWDGRAGLWQQPGLFLLGWVLVIARWATGGDLALAWGLHAGWVWALACLGEFVQPQPVAAKPVWLTGRSAQPLTDVLDLGLMVITAGFVWQLFRAIA
ncbi:MAG: lysostaphin resistance A-like protein [Leptolyngbyaceae cyanobacterium]